MVVGIAKIEIFFPETNSLKSKRRILKALIHKLESQFKKISLAEVDGHNLWQKTTLGLSVVGKDQKFVDSKLTSILNFIKKDGSIEIIKAEIDFISY
uniref:DUF503 domain-containing protein n=1 Tax=Thermodesulfobacterium geofontis TaxID=1295609 RepID=A0A7V4JRH5_9BACT